MPKVGVATTKFLVALRAPVAELPLSKFLNPPLCTVTVSVGSSLYGEMSTKHERGKHDMSDTRYDIRTPHLGVT